MPIARTIFLSLALLGGLVSTASAQKPDGEGMQVVIPQGWTMVHTNNVPGLEEYYYAPLSTPIPQQQDLLIYQETKGQGGVDVASVLEGLVNVAKSTCPRVETGPPQQGPINNYPAGFIVISCPREADGQWGKLSLILAIVAKESTYTVQRVWRTPPYRQGTKPVIDTEITSWMQYIRGIMVCDTRDPNHPCAVQPSQSQGDPRFQPVK